MKAKYCIFLFVCIFWIVIGFVGSWLDRVPVSAQDASGNMGIELTSYTYPLIFRGDTTKTLFTLRPADMSRCLLELLNEFKTYCDTVVIEGIKMTGSTMSVEGLMDWLENVKLKGNP